MLCVIAHKMYYITKNVLVQTMYTIHTMSFRTLIVLVQTMYQYIKCILILILYIMFV